MDYAVVGFDPDAIDRSETPVAVEQWYDRQTRSWVTYLINADGGQVGDASYDGNRAGAAGCPVCPIWPGWPLPQLGVPHATSSEESMSIDDQNFGPMPV